jgi:hypothetical protein
MAASTILTDPAGLIRQLDADAIRERIEAIDREREALKVLLRAEHKQPPSPAPEGAST